jgi:cardiolipin synthase
MMHGKGVIKDDDWAMVGSSNLDQSSFYDNYEANLEIKNKKNIQQLKKTILNWIGSAKKLDDFNWKRRGNWQRLKEKIAFKLCQLWHIKKG